MLFFSSDHSKAVFTVAFFFVPVSVVFVRAPVVFLHASVVFDHASVVSYMMFVFSLFVPHLSFFWCLRKAVLCDCDISLLFICFIYSGLRISIVRS